VDPAQGAEDRRLPPTATVAATTAFTGALRRSAHRSITVLEADIRKEINERNKNPRPFVWTNSVDDIPETLAAPPAQASTIRAHKASGCDVFRRRAKSSSAHHSPSVSTTGTSFGLAICPA
jgi:hypothetical protein